MLALDLLNDTWDVILLISETLRNGIQFDVGFVQLRNDFMSFNRWWLLALITPKFRCVGQFVFQVDGGAQRLLWLFIARLLGQLDVLLDIVSARGIGPLTTKRSCRRLPPSFILGFLPVILP